jgi:hypothetical protein
LVRTRGSLTSYEQANCRESDESQSMTRLKRAYGSIQSRSLNIINRTLDAAEKSLAPGRGTFCFSPTFIIGAPRSGSTVFYQTLVNAFSFGYLTNLHCQLYGAPYLLQAAVGRWLPQAQSPYTSEHGQVDGLMSPSECGQFWYRWFRRRPQYVPIEDIDMRQLQSLRRVLIGLTNAFGQPLLFKNLNCALRLQPLAALLPEARFIYIRRNPLWMAQSLLLGRQRVHGNKDIWWSLEPPNIDELRGLPPEEQVVRQVDSIHRLILKEMQTIGPERFLSVPFENFCSDVRGTLGAVRLFLLHSGVELAPRFKVPDTLPVADVIRLPQEEFGRLGALVEATCPYDLAA